MPLPKKVVIEDIVIPEVDEVTIEVSNPVDSSTGKRAAGPTEPAKVTLTRRARSQPMIHFFKAAANPESAFWDGAGLRGLLDGEIVLQSPAGEETYTIKLYGAAVDQYKFEQPNDDADLKETVTFTAWELEISAPGVPSKYFFSAVWGETTGGGGIDETVSE